MLTNERSASPSPSLFNTASSDDPAELCDVLADEPSLVTTDGLVRSGPGRSGSIFGFVSVVVVVVAGFLLVGRIDPDPGSESGNAAPGSPLEPAGAVSNGYVESGAAEPPLPTATPAPAAGFDPRISVANHDATVVASLIDGQLTGQLTHRR